MRAMIALVLGLVTAGVTPALAAECRGGSQTLLVLEDWAVTPSDEPGQVTIEATLRYDGERPIRMAEGGVWFYDALDREIFGLPIEPDLVISAGQEYHYARGVAGGGVDRIQTINHSDVVAFTCISAVVYADGTKEEF